MKTRRIVKKNLEKNQNGLIIGSFESIHFGHINLLKTAQKKYQKLTIMIIENKPHTKNFYQLDRRIQQLKKFSKVTVVFLDERIKNMDPEKFIQEFIEPLKVDGAVVGSDFRFGFERTGTPRLLDKFIPTTIIDVGSEKISTESIRELLNKGDMRAANRLLHEPFSFSGKVVHGDRVARKLDFATANLELEKKYASPPAGVYAAICQHKKALYNAMLYLREDPKKENLLKIEAHFFKFNQSIYNQKIVIFPLFFIRAPIKFKDFNQAKEEIFKDYTKVCEVFKKNHRDVLILKKKLNRKISAGGL